MAEKFLVSGSATTVSLDLDTAAGVIDFSLLRPDATRLEVAQHCAEAVKYGFHSISVPLCHVAQCVSALRGTGLKVASVVAFPLGSTSSTIKLAESREALRLGAQELEVAMNLG